MTVLRIGTRGSELALVQSRLLADQLKKSNPAIVPEIIPIKTLGDRKQGTAAAGVSDKKEWVIDLEIALLENKIDLAIHSGKDVPAELEAGTSLLPVLKRENPFDVFIGKKISGNDRLSFSDLEQASTVGTASLRRKSALLRLRPDIRVVDHRGNVPTRIRKLDESSELSGIVLAAAGILRLGISDLEYEVLSLNQMIPGVNQGILAAQFREQDSGIRSVIEKISDPDTYAAFWAERRCVELLEGDCNSAIGIFARVDGENLELNAVVYDQQHGKHLEKTVVGPKGAPEELGAAVAGELLKMGARELLS